jgi:hypothetical protein
LAFISRADHAVGCGGSNPDVDEGAKKRLETESPTFYPLCLYSACIFFFSGRGLADIDTSRFCNEIRLTRESLAK